MPGFHKGAARRLAGAGAAADNKAMSSVLSPLSVTVNGEPMGFAPGMTVAGLIADLGLDTRKVAVERNREIVLRSTYPEVRLEAGDQFEIVHFIGGG